MMLESVCIVLNEREPIKEKTAQALSDKLTEDGITVSRVPIDEHIESIIVEKTPKVLVLDYLLGDYSTGLDIMARLEEVEEAHRPKTLFLTDEPSVSVAVEAMRLGAVNYFELENPQSVNNAVWEIKRIIRENSTPPRAIARKVHRTRDLIAHSKVTQAAVQRLRTLANTQAPIVVMQGPPGCGKSTFAEALHHERGTQAHLLTIDLALYDRPFDSLGFVDPDHAHSLQLGKNLSLIVKHAEEDDGEFIEAVADASARFWPAGASKQNPSYLTVCTTSSETARAWVKLTGAEVLELPVLDKERKEDFAPLVQRFITEASTLSGDKLKPADGETVKWLGTLEWPESVRGFRALIIDAALTSHSTGDSLRDVMEQRIALREDLASEALDEMNLIDPLTAATTLEMCDFRYRVAAAKLGCSVQRLRELIHSEPVN